MDALSAFPRRPLQVRLGLKQGAALAAAAVIGSAMLAGFIFLGATFGMNLLREPRVWTNGQEAPIESLRGECRIQISLLPLSYCSLDLTYRSPDGAVRAKEILALLYAGMKPSDKAELKIDPENPDDVALSWLINRIEERWIVLVGLCLVGLGLGALICAGLIKSLSEWRLYRAMGRAPRPIAATIVDMRHVTNPNYAREYTFRYRADGQEKQSRQRLRVLKGMHGLAPEQWDYEAPILLDDSKALALLGPNGRALLVLRSFYPLVLAEDERQKILGLSA